MLLEAKLFIALRKGEGGRGPSHQTILIQQIEILPTLIRMLDGGYDAIG